MVEYISRFSARLPAALREPAVLWSLSIGLGILCLITVLALPYFIARLPADYFVAEASSGGRGGASRGLLVARNVLGAILVVAGLAMLVLPGQGVLTILAGLVFLEFPGKRKLERRLLLQPRVLQALNSMRRRAGRPPFEVALSGQHEQN